MKSPFKFGKGGTLAPRFVGPFRILERIGPVSYIAKLPSHLGKMHNVFHILVLRHYMPGPSHILKLDKLQLSKEGVIQVEPYCILDHRTRQLHRRIMDQVKVQWDQYSPQLDTWEDVNTMRREFPYLFE